MRESAYHKEVFLKFTTTRIPGAFVLQMQAHEDHRGYFSRLFCRDEFQQHGLDPNISQINTGLTLKAGTVRGVHFQAAPHADNKYIRCLNGSIYDVCVDLRPDSPTFQQYFAIELSRDNRTMLYLPAGCGHAYQTLVDDSEIMYTTNQPFEPESATGVRYDDPAFAIEWPLKITEISETDRNWPNFKS